MADIEGDGTTTVRKLEGFQIHLQAKRSRFMASGVPSLDVLSITLVISHGPHRFPGYDVNSIADRLARGYDRSPVAFSCAGQSHH